MNDFQSIDIDIILANRLKYLRKSRDKTQQDIANMLNITRPAYSAYERAKRSPDFKHLEKLINYYNVSFDFIFGRDSLPNIDDIDIAIILDSILEEVKHKNELVFFGDALSNIAKENLFETIELLIKQIDRINKKETLNI
ncbi:helix-turn-helix domain-containing protein [Lysinibacillus sp. UGB7]|uniref:helix-turn-helix domain-containing protein n=1 Tax=Lysinibacillus sp. UGB7 TaxID=3411039 RepID=UPI003B76DD17